MKRLILIDANAIVHKAFYALPVLTNREGEQINAIYGFSSILLKVIDELQPDYIAAAYDLPVPTFRHKEYEEYKAKRPKKPPELIEQIPKTKEILKAFSVPILEKEGFEADDIIGTIAQKFGGKTEIIILTGDLDILQLVDRNIKVYGLRKGMTDTVIYDKKKTEDKYKLKVDQLIDYKALRGDSSDNIPGVKGIGEKGATFLLKEFKTLENLYKNIDKVKNKSIADKLKQNKEMAFFSKKLATIRRDVPIKLSLKDLDWKNNFNVKKAEQVFNQFHFRSLIKRLPGYKPEPEAQQSNLF